MSTLSVCPSTLVAAPVERVWELVTRTDGLDRWADATVVAAEPEGPVRAGQQLYLVTRELGWTFAITFHVREVDAERRRVRLLIELPMGVENDETITMADAGGGRTLVRFG